VALPQVGLAATSRSGEPRDAALGGAPFHDQALAALGLAGAGADREVELGGLPPVDERLLARSPAPPQAAVHASSKLRVAHALPACLNRGPSS